MKQLVNYITQLKFKTINYKTTLKLKAVVKLSKGSIKIHIMQLYMFTVKS